MANIDDDVHAWAAALPEKPPLSKLEPYAGAISELRRKRYTYEEIAKLLSERFGLAVHSTSILRFLQRERKKAKAAGGQARVLPNTLDANVLPETSTMKTFSYRPGQAFEEDK